jgi:hypothetical protein
MFGSERRGERRERRGMVSTKPDLKSKKLIIPDALSTLQVASRFLNSSISLSINFLSFLLL